MFHLLFFLSFIFSSLINYYDARRLEYIRFRLLYSFFSPFSPFLLLTHIFHAQNTHVYTRFRITYVYPPIHSFLIFLYSYSYHVFLSMFTFVLLLFFSHLLKEGTRITSGFSKTFDFFFLFFFSFCFFHFFFLFNN